MPGPPRKKHYDETDGEAVEGTRLESVEDIRRAMAQMQAPPPPGPPRMGTVKEVVVAPSLPFRPVRRPPMALLCILDDGRSDGEWVRIRGDGVVIGRGEGDVVIPHDTMMSGRHAEVERRAIQGRYRWLITDLDSTNGTFVRVSSAVLKQGTEVLVGGRKLRFDAASAGEADDVTTLPDGVEVTPETRGWQTVRPTDIIPSLVEVTPKGEGQRFLLDQPELYIGRDKSQCAVALTNDLHVCPRHARVWRDENNTWRVENAGSVNGLWLRVSRMALDGGGQFQLGEQRFLLRVLS